MIIKMEIPDQRKNRFKATLPNFIYGRAVGICTTTTNIWCLFYFTLPALDIILQEYKFLN